MGKTARISGIRATKEEKETLERILSALGMSKSEWLCELIEAHSRLLEEMGLNELERPRLSLAQPPTHRLQTVLSILFRSAGKDDPTWIQDQIVRALLRGDAYDEWRRQFEERTGRKWQSGRPPSSNLNLNS